MLFFGKDMDRSVLNQNQIGAHIRHCGGTVQDDFTKDGDFGIDTKDTFIPFYMEGSAISFDSHIPSDHELQTLPQVVITSKKPWDPKSNPLRIHGPGLTLHSSNQRYNMKQTTFSDQLAKHLGRTRTLPQGSQQRMHY